MDESLKAVPFMESVNARYFRQVMERSAHVGLSREDIGKVASDVDLFLNQFGGFTAVLSNDSRIKGKGISSS